MQQTRITLLYSGALLLIGVGIGCGGILLSQQWTTRSGQTITRPSEPEPAPKLVSTLLLRGEPIMGSPSAPITIVEFSDFECTYCKLFHDQVLPELKQQYVDSGLVRFVHKDLPLPFHRQARPAAAAARCAGEQQRYWEMYNAIFEQQNCLDCKGVEKVAEETGLDRTELKACMAQESTQELINSNLSEAKLHNIRATPTFIIGPSLPNGQHDGEIVEGAIPWTQFKAIIDKKLKALKTP